MTATTAKATTPKFVIVTDEDETLTYSRKIDALNKAASLEEDGVTCTVTTPKGEVIWDTIEADEDDADLEDGEHECPECGEAKEETAFPTLPATKTRAAGERNMDECRSCRDDRLATGGRKIAGSCSVACRTSTGDHDEKKCQCICNGAGHGTEAVQVAAA